MATVQSVVDSARYDLKDQKVRFGDTELLEYLNRAVGVLDSVLTALNSDLVHGSETGIDTVTDQNYVDLSSDLNSGNWDSIRSVWIGTTKLVKYPLDRIIYKQQFNSTSGQPYYWALEGNNIVFEKDADQVYSDLKIYYNKKTATLALTDSMPYTDRFNDLIRESTVLMAEAKRNDEVKSADAMFYETFMRKAIEEEIRRSYYKKPYYKDF